MDIVGFLRRKKTPSRFARILSYTCEYNNIRLLYMTPNDIDMRNHIVSGKMYINHKWEEVTVPLPKFIDINPYLYTNAAYTSKLNYLKKRTNVSIPRSHAMKKDRLQKELRKHPQIHEYSIPSSKIKNYKEFLEFIVKNKEIVVKPVTGLQGKSVMIIRQLHSNSFMIGLNKEQKEMNEREMHQYFKRNFENKNFMMQKYIISRTKSGDPFDCRIHMEKGISNQWEITNMFVRVGLGQSVISNINQGGGISKVKPFLNHNFQELKKVILKKLDNVAMRVPSEIERITNTQLMTMGLDVGIDPEGNIYLFEINGFPIVLPQLSEISLIRPQYYKYMLETNGQEIKE